MSQTMNYSKIPPYVLSSTDFGIHIVTPQIYSGAALSPIISLAQVRQQNHASYPILKCLCGRKKRVIYHGEPGCADPGGSSKWVILFLLSELYPNRQGPQNL